eukprot:TRINITY_DN5023_c0_g1_i2.p1 TRINITY_DN5023_c0_g1~~TRINITY_DN5023_c0_g1_i2.p1  ORF type:complete len:318 (+),score=53.71 TRINITY_DN5023_c0_g1_i2:197-1150(+)
MEVSQQQEIGFPPSEQEDKGLLFQTSRTKGVPEEEKNQFTPNKKQKVGDSEKEAVEKEKKEEELKAHIHLNDEYKSNFYIPWKYLIAGSTLFKNLFESIGDKENAKVELKLENPSIFMDVLHFLKTNQLTPKLNHNTQFVKYISDANYLGIEELENLFHEKFVNAAENLRLKTIVLPTTSAAYYGFLERFLASQNLKRDQKFQLLVFVENWGSRYGLDDKNLQNLLQKCIDVDLLSLQQVQTLSKEHPRTLNLLVPANVLVDRFFTYIGTCRSCQKKLTESEIITGTCDKRVDKEHKIQKDSRLVILDELSPQGLNL